MLTEDEVVEAVCEWLRADGYEITQQLLATQRGFDIVARRDGIDLVVEAKGAGSSKSHTARHGREFDSGQVFSHVAKAVLKALRVVSEGKSRGAIALPDNAAHRREIDQVAAVLADVGITVFWVDEQRRVQVEVRNPAERADMERGIHREQEETPGPVWSWREGAVDERADHLRLTYAPLDLLVATVASPVDGVFPVRFVDRRDEADFASARDAVRRELDFYLLEVGKPDPWSYAIYHCGTMSNFYSDVRWSWHPAGGTEEARS